MAFLFSVFLMSCGQTTSPTENETMETKPTENQPTENPVNDSTTEAHKQKTTPAESFAEILENPVLKQWEDFYSKHNPDFSVSDLIFAETTEVDFIPGNVYGIFDEEFDSTYWPFLIFNSDSLQYLDIDSYQWFVDNGELTGSPDQAIQWVDVNQKTVTRIGFYGPSQWVEDAFWKDDSTVVFLEKDSEGNPSLTIMNLHTRTSAVYAGETTIEGDYNSHRMKTKGIDVR